MLHAPSLFLSPLIYLSAPLLRSPFLCPPPPSPIQIEGLLEDVYFRTKVTRAEFESMCSDLLEQVGDPVRQALEAADMTMVRNSC